MDEGEMVDTLESGDPLQRQLARYARVRLEPDPAAMRRIRTAAMEAAWRQRLETPVLEAAPAATSPVRVPFVGWSTRRLGSTFAAAVLAGLLVAGTVFAGSRAGGPLYETRLGIEMAFLPTDPAARIQAELAFAQTRLAEASQAAVVGDEGALEAALAAYGQVVEAISGAQGGPAGQALAAVQVHLDVLRELQSRLPAAAGPAMERAIERSGGAIDTLSNANAAPPGVGGDGGNPEAGGGATGDPGTETPTQKPDRSVRQERTRGPIASQPPASQPPIAPEPRKSP